MCTLHVQTEVPLVRVGKTQCCNNSPIADSETALRWAVAKQSEATPTKKRGKDAATKSNACAASLLPCDLGSIAFVSLGRGDQCGYHRHPRRKALFLFVPVRQLTKNASASKKASSSTAPLPHRAWPTRSRHPAQTSPHDSPCHAPRKKKGEAKCANAFLFPALTLIVAPVCSAGRAVAGEGDGRGLCGRVSGHHRRPRFLFVSFVFSRRPPRCFHGRQGCLRAWWGRRPCWALWALGMGDVRGPAWVTAAMTPVEGQIFHASGNGQARKRKSRWAAGPGNEAHGFEKMDI